MTSYRREAGFLEVPHAAVYLLMTANIAVYGLCLSQSGTVAIPAELLFRSSAMYSQAIERHQYWRLIAYGFLHGNLFHLATNMLCLALWGGHLEKRVGSLYFSIIYVFALMAGAIVSNLTHSQPYLTVGASAATSGVLGALLCLWILGKVDISANFFIINIGLNIAFAASVRNIDWAAHLGGFAAGLVSCAVLDLVEKVNSLVLRCKFPEFIKVNIAVILGASGLLLWGNRPAALTLTQEGSLPVLALAAAGLLAIKLVDFTLSLKKGLAVIVIMLSMANAALVLFAGRLLASQLPSGCISLRPGGMIETEQLLSAACSNSGLVIGIAAACSCVLTILLYSQELDRGIKDVGFVGASFRAERKRRWGI
jgi:membrane associated rhomboid family serine protease